MKKNQKIKRTTKLRWNEPVTQGFINDMKKHVDERVVHKSGERGQ